MSCNAKKDPNGTWRIQYRWTDWTGTKKKSQKRGFKTKKEAEFKLYKYGFKDVKINHHNMEEGDK